MFMTDMTVLGVSDVGIPGFKLESPLLSVVENYFVIAVSTFTSM